MKRILSLLFAITLFFCTHVLAEDASQARIDSGIVGVWIETEGYGTLTMRADGTASMAYDSGIVSDCSWELTKEGGRFTDGMWFGSAIEMETGNILSVAGGWMRFTREGVDVELPETDLSELNPVPVGEAGIPFLGTWTLESIEADGASLSPALLGMEMTLTLTEDGLVTIYDGMESLTAVWYVEYDAAIIDGTPMTLREDGKLVASDADSALVFTPGEAEAGEELSEEEALLALLALMSQMEDDAVSDLPEEHQGFVGSWNLCHCAADGLTGDLRPIGITASLTLYEDYTGYLWCYPEMENGQLLRDTDGSWLDAEGVICFGEHSIPLFLLGDEASPGGVFLQYGTRDDGYLIFSQDEEAVWDPAAYELQPANADAAVSEPIQSSTGSGPLNIRYICRKYTTAGITGDAAVLGAEYAVIFHEDGTADFTMAGFTMPALPYTITDDGVYAINYYGTFFNCVPTDAGFDLDYYGTMTLHLTPES